MQKLIKAAVMMGDDGAVRTLANNQLLLVWFFVKEIIDIGI